MGFWGFLKGIIPEKLINVEIDNRKIEITNSSVVIGNATINDAELVKKILNKLKESQADESLPCQIVHKELDNSYEEYEELSIVMQESLKKLKEVLPNEEIECVLMARRVKLAYDKANAELGKELHKQLMETYPKKGYKVYNLIGGGYFDEMIIPFIDIFKSEYGDKYLEEYRSFYSSIISFFPLAFFVGNSTTEEQIIKGLNERLRLDVPFVRLHAIGASNIEKLKNAIKKLDIEDKYSTNANGFTSATGLKALIFEIKLKRQNQ